MKNKRSISSLLTLMLLSCFLLQPAAGQQAPKTFSKGYLLTAEQAQGLEEEVAANADAVEARKMLIGYYYLTGLQYQLAFLKKNTAKFRQNKNEAPKNIFKGYDALIEDAKRNDPLIEDEKPNLEAKKRMVEHILWLIANEPESKFFLTPSPCYRFRNRDSLGYQEASHAWEKLMKDHPQNVDILRNATQWFNMLEKTKAEELADRGKQLDRGDSFFPEFLGKNYMRKFRSTADENEKSELAKKAFDEFKLAYELADDTKRLSLNGNLARTALEVGALKDAKEYANKLLDITPSDLNFANNVHVGNTLLGLIAMKTGNLEEARNKLLAAGAIKASRKMQYRGPSMALAAELLKHDQREVVLEYFALCREFWTRGSENVDRWSNEVNRGKTPKFKGQIFPPHLSGL